MKVTVEFQPIGRRIEIEAGETLLEAAQAAGVGLSAVCGGAGTCGTCRVRLERGAPINPPDRGETGRLSAGDLASGYRLACLTVVSGDLTVDVPPASLTAPQRVQVEGSLRQFCVDPPVRTFEVTVPPPGASDLRADWERLRAELISAGAPAGLRVPWPVLTGLSEDLRRNGWRVRAVTRSDELAAVLPPEAPVLGLAVDLGTTKIAVYLADLLTGTVPAKTGLMNPQIAYGEDVMARISYAVEKPAGLKTLQDAVIGAISEAAATLCRAAADERPDLKGISPKNVLEAVVVGNTAMHHLFLGLPVRQLGLAPYVPAAASALSLGGRELGLNLAPGARVHLLPNVAGFVGADHVAMLLSTDADRADGVVLRLDIGTNTEITLAAGGRLYACSTASGPAFEGARIRHGMRAAAGAIERVRIEDRKIEYTTVGDAPPVGLCGSGVLDAVAELYRAGMIDARGSFVPGLDLVRRGDQGPEIVLAPAERTGHGRDVTLNRRDVGEIQLAKGAIRTGLEILLEEAGLTSADLEGIIVAGAFGTYIDVESAITIGLLPPVAPAIIRQVGNAAGMGALMALLSQTERRRAEDLAGRVEYLELTGRAVFQDRFMKAILLPEG